MRQKSFRAAPRRHRKVRAQGRGGGVVRRVIHIHLPNFGKKRVKKRRMGRARRARPAARYRQGFL
jgi:hypothetical protein